MALTVFNVKSERMDSKVADGLRMRTLFSQVLAEWSGVGWSKRDVAGS
jgi:hypothetical protein